MNVCPTLISRIARAVAFVALTTAATPSFAASNFTMLDSTGGLVGGTNDVAATWDGTFNTSSTGTNFNMTLSSTTPFFTSVWSAHHVRVFAPGTYTIDTTCTVGQIEAGTCTPNADPSKNYTFTVQQGQIGAHMLFDWNGVTDIDVVNVWDVARVFSPSSLYTGPAGSNPAGTRWGLMSSDVDGNGFNGLAMIDGPFSGFSANFNVTLASSSSGISPSTYRPTVGVGDPSGAAGCSLSAQPVRLSERGDWWAIAGFIVWLGILRWRRKYRH